MHTVLLTAHIKLQQHRRRLVCQQLQHLFHAQVAVYTATHGARRGLEQKAGVGVGGTETPRARLISRFEQNTRRYRDTMLCQQGLGCGLVIHDGAHAARRSVALRTPKKVRAAAITDAEQLAAATVVGQAGKALAELAHLIVKTHGESALKSRQRHQVGVQAFVRESPQGSHDKGVADLAAALERWRLQLRWADLEGLAGGARAPTPAPSPHDRASIPPLVSLLASEVRGTRETAKSARSSR